MDAENSPLSLLLTPPEKNGCRAKEEAGLIRASHIFFIYDQKSKSMMLFHLLVRGTH
jgi:hypothetical protein